jgi:ABC-type uncharacterized transport system permease subunit
MNIDLVAPLLAAAVVSGTPLIYATLGAMFTEKSGVLNLGVEGIMLLGCLGAFFTAKFSGSPWLGFVAGGVIGAIAASLHGLVCLVFQGNQVVSGLALTLLGGGLANYFGTGFVGQAARVSATCLCRSWHSSLSLGRSSLSMIPWSTAAIFCRFFYGCCSPGAGSDSTCGPWVSFPKQLWPPGSTRWAIVGSGSSPVVF